MGEIVDMPPPHNLTPEQEAHWWKVLEDAERAVEYAKRVLGLLAVEQGLEE